MNVFFFILTALVQSGIPAGLDVLTAAYPESLVQPGADFVTWKDGSRMEYGSVTAQAGIAFEERCDRATLADQMSISYPAGWPVDVPSSNKDPGRLRYEPFFRKMYGDSRAQVGKNLVRVKWLPAGEKKELAFSKVNGASKALESVAAELAACPADVRRYAAKPIGTFEWRTISKTGRLSMHSLGIALDLELPNGCQRYWQWDSADADRPCVYPKVILGDEKLGAVVKIFERHGFIWGGKWDHYDTMHFEYRPELLSKAQEVQE